MSLKNRLDCPPCLDYTSILPAELPFNPIENCWSKVKEFLRAKAARTYETLDQAITEAFNAVTSEDMIGWFTHCCYYVAPDAADCTALI